MTFSHMRAGLIAGAALSLMASGAVFAQPAPGPGKPHAGMMAEHHDPAKMAQKLRDALQLHPDQEPALQAFIGSMKGHEDEMAEQGEGMKGLTTPQRLDRMAAMMAQHQQQFAQHADAVKRFYAALTPAQQKAFDTLHDGMMGKMGHHGGMGGHRMGMGHRDGGKPQG